MKKNTSDDQKVFIPMAQIIPVNEPVLGEQELEYVKECIQTGWISSAGRFVDEFESAWAAYCGRKYGIAVSNGTVALELAIKALNFSPGDEIIIPSFTIISCVQAVIYAGFKPVLVDADPHTWCMDVSKIEERLTSRTRAIMPVHIYGHPVDMDPIMELADQYGLAVIEDAAEVHGGEYLTDRGKDQPTWSRCGSFGEVSCFSFYANKIITTGEGGMVLTNNSEIANRIRSLRNLCFEPNRRFYHSSLGHNYRLTNIQAAIGLGQLEKIEKTLDHKRWMGKTYTDMMSKFSGIQLPIEKSWAHHVYWMYGIVVDEKTGLSAAEFSNRLLKLGVMTRPFFLGMHEQPALHKIGLFKGEHYPIAEHLARQGFYLPSGQAITDEQVEKVVQAMEIVLSSVD